MERMESRDGMGRDQKTRPANGNLQARYIAWARSFPLPTPPSPFFVCSSRPIYPSLSFAHRICGAESRPTLFGAHVPDANLVCFFRHTKRAASAPSQPTSLLLSSWLLSFLPSFLVSIMCVWQP